MDRDDELGGDGQDLLRSRPFRTTAPDDDYACAVEARSCVDTAVGIIMGKYDCTRNAALVRLQRTASQFHVTTLELARALVSSSGTSPTR